MIRNFFAGVTLILLLPLASEARHTEGVERFSIFGRGEKLPTRPGAAHLIDETELEKFDFLDVHQVLRSVPGVNLQEEDGLGLRPNIGLRGAHPHRSKNVTLMEDGVLIGPAPYSAPAAYYFPSLEKIYNFEIYKGPAAVRFGPNSIGGAINMITRRHQPGVIFDLSYGQFNAQKYQLSSGFKGAGLWSVDAVHASHDGFKNLPTGDNTGYERNNFFVRWDKELAAQQHLTVKLNYANELSNETYLGLSNDDFNLGPFDRYSASQFDRMEWTHQQAFLQYDWIATENYSLMVRTYHHTFARDWNKFDGFFANTVEAWDILRRPYLSSNSQFFNILSGQTDTVAADNSDKIRITDSRRQFLSRGVQLINRFDLLTGFGDHELQLGYRLHSDQVERNHFSNFYDMRSGLLQFSGLPGETVVQNRHQAVAHTAFIHDQVTFDDFEVSGGLRLENVTYDTFDDLTNGTTKTSEAALVPGIGVFYQLSNHCGFLAGINKGVNLVGPGQASDIRQEEAINYELGFRHSADWGFEVIGFYSDYKNIRGACSQSSGCIAIDLDRQFNGGEAEIYGAELLLSTEGRWHSLSFPLRLSATYTLAEFRSNFTSALNTWGSGNVRSGDPLPYIPEWQGQLASGVSYKNLQTFVNLNYVGAVADQAVAVDRNLVPAYFVVHTSLQYQWSEKLRFMVRVDNLFNERYAVSYRPFGVRPGRPFSALVGMRYAL